MVFDLLLRFNFGLKEGKELEASENKQATHKNAKHDNYKTQNKHTTKKRGLKNKWKTQTNTINPRKITPMQK